VTTAAIRVKICGVCIFEPLRPLCEQELSLFFCRPCGDRVEWHIVDLNSHDSLHRYALMTANGSSVVTISVRTLRYHAWRVKENLASSNDVLRFSTRAEDR